MIWWETSGETLLHFVRFLRFLSSHNITLIFTLFPLIWTYFHFSFHFITLHWPWLCLVSFEHIFTFPFISKHSIDLDFVLYHLNDLVRIKIVQFDRLTIHVYERTFINHCGPSSSYPIIQVYERPFINYHRPSNRGDTSL